MDKTKADIVAERVNPKKRSMSEQIQEMKMDKARRDAMKRPMREPLEDVDMEEAMRRKRDEEGYNKSMGAMKKGGMVKKYAKGGSVSASKRADGCAQRGKTRGKMV